jgi:ribonuclease HI
MISYIVKGDKFNAIIFNDTELEKLKKEDTSIKFISYDKEDSLKEEVLKFKYKKLYAVKNGLINGIFFDWTTCSRMVNNFTGAMYKSFQTLDDAINYMELEKKESLLENGSNKIPYAYVDGSYNAKTKTYGYGVIIVDNESEYEFFDSDNDTDMCSMQNVAGEILGAQRAISEAIAIGLPEINIYYDYQGIECWANGTWKRNKKGTMEYHEFVKEARKLITVNFYKVKAHSGVELNEKVDKLAKKSVGL